MEGEEEKIEKIFRKDRWYLRITNGEHSKTVLQANYVCLQGNPAFLDIPVGYVIHHLDGDKQNDDISNLVIMQKQHHVAYHWKHKIVEPELNLADWAVKVGRTFYIPLNQPKIYKHGDGFRIYIREQAQDGRKKTVWVSKWEGKPIETREMAEWVKSELLKMKAR